MRGRALAALVVVVVCAAGACSQPSRQEVVAERGREVMPFDLERTTHVFEPTDVGLVQTVVADPPVEAEQVELIRAHLTEEAERFARGDFGDPASIHGHDMPGLAALEKGHESIAVDYTEVDTGARITYTTDDPALVEALHQWADAQTHDHGDHAEQHTG